MFFTIQPIAIGILLFGDVYYQKKGVIKSFGLANRIVAGIIALGIPFYYYHLFTNDSKPGFVTKKIVREEEGLKSKVKESVVSSSNPIRDELLTYVNVELPKIADLETSAVNSYSSVTGSNYKDDETTYKAVRDDVLPKYKEFRDKLEAISIKLKTTEVRKLNESYIDAANTQLSAFSILLAAIDKQDLTLISQANEKLDKGRKLMRVTLNEFSVLAEKNKVEFKGK